MAQRQLRSILLRAAGLCPDSDHHPRSEQGNEYCGQYTEQYSQVGHSLPSHQLASHFTLERAVPTSCCRKIAIAFTDRRRECNRLLTTVNYNCDQSTCRPFQDATCKLGCARNRRRNVLRVATSAREVGLSTRTCLPWDCGSMGAAIPSGRAWLGQQQLRAKARVSAYNRREEEMK
jgi:hypothetical protein